MNNMTIWIVMIAIMVISFIIQRVLQSKFEKYGRVRNPLGLTGAQTAEWILKENGIYDVSVDCIDGTLTDHYDPGARRVNLSQEVYEGNSVAAAAIAAHECGHVLQHKEGYAPLKLRTAMVPVVTVANKTVQWVLLAGVLLINVFPSLLWVGIILFAATTLFSLVTLPVEINASSRAINWLESKGMNGEERAMAAESLRWAAYTYVIAALGSLATLFYYITIARRR